MKRIVSLILMLVCLCFTANTLAEIRERPDFGSQNTIEKEEELKGDTTKLSNPKHGIVHGKVRVYGYKDRVKAPANRFAPYAVFPDVAHVEGLYLEYYYKKISSSERVWEVCVVDEDGYIEYCDDSRVQIILPYPSIWSAEQQIYWKWTERYARKHYDWDYAFGKILGYYEVRFKDYVESGISYIRGPYYSVKDFNEFGPRIEFARGELVDSVGIFIKNSKK